MKAAVLILLVAMVVVVYCRPDAADAKHDQAEEARKKACLKNCAGVKVNVVCASNPKGESKSFGNVCVMGNHNCEHQDTFKVRKSGKCSPNDGVRLVA